MVKAAPNNSYESHDVTVDLGELRGILKAEQAAASFIACMKNLNAERLKSFALLSNGHAVPTAHQKSPFSHGCSPSDWVNDEAQMSKGGDGSGGNWISH